MEFQKEIVLNGIVYEAKKDNSELPFVLVRTYSAGVHYGYLNYQNPNNPKHIKLSNARRIYEWQGACSLSQVAVDGIDANNSKVSVPVPSMELTEAIEIIEISGKAVNNLKEIKEWKK